MLSFAQMEKYYELLAVIDQYKRLLEQYDTSLKAARIDSVPRGSACQMDRLGELLIQRERAMENLPKLQALADTKASLVEDTIKAVAGKGKNAVKAELIFRARYQNGRDWAEIGELIRQPNTALLKAFVIRRLEP